MSDGWKKKILLEHSYINIESPFYSDADWNNFVCNLFQKGNDKDQTSFINDFFEQPDSLTEIDLLNPEAQKLILLKFIQKNTVEILSDAVVLKFLLQKLGIDFLLAMNKADIPWDKIPATLITAMLKECHKSKIWDLYFRLINISFLPSGDDASFFEDLKKPENEEALKHIAIFIIKEIIEDEEILKKAMRLLLKDYALQLNSVIAKKPNLEQLLIAELLEKSDGFEDWDNYFKMREMKFEHGDNFANFKEDLIKKENEEALKYLLPSLLAHSKIEPSILKNIAQSILDENMGNIPIESIILMDSHEQFKKHPSYDVFLPTPQWEVLFQEHLDTLSKLNPKAFAKLFHLNAQNPLIAAIESSNDKALTWVFESLLKLDNLEYSNKILKDFLGSKQKIKTENPQILELLIKLLLKNPEQKKILKTVQEKCHSNLRISELLERIYTAFSEEELYKLFTQTFDRWTGNNIFMQELDYGSKEISLQLLKIIGTLEEKIQQQILKQTNKNGKNALMLAACYHPQAVTQILQKIDDSPEGKALLSEILKQTDKNGENALILAARYLPQAVTQILQKIDDSPEGKALLSEILKQTDKDGGNALMQTVCHRPQAVTQILQTQAVTQILQKIDDSPEGKALLSEILKQTHTNGWNALFRAMVFSHSAAPVILKKLESLDVGSQDNILTVSAVYNQNILKPQSLIPFLSNIFKYHIENNQYNPKFEINVEDAHFNIMQCVYHLNGCLKENEKKI